MKNFDSARINDNAAGAANARASEYAGARAEAYGAMSDLGKRGDKSQGYPMPKLELGEDSKEKAASLTLKAKRAAKAIWTLTPKSKAAKMAA